MSTSLFLETIAKLTPLQRLEALLSLHPEHRTPDEQVELDIARGQVLDEERLIVAARWESGRYGHFHRDLGKALWHADAGNTRKIRREWLDAWQRALSDHGVKMGPWYDSD